MKNNILFNIVYHVSSCMRIVLNTYYLISSSIWNFSLPCSIANMWHSSLFLFIGIQSVLFSLNDLTTSIYLEPQVNALHANLYFQFDDSTKSHTCMGTYSHDGRKVWYVCVQWQPRKWARALSCLYTLICIGKVKWCEYATKLLDTLIEWFQVRYLTPKLTWDWDPK